MRRRARNVTAALVVLTSVSLGSANVLGAFEGDAATSLHEEIPQGVELRRQLDSDGPHEPVVGPGKLIVQSIPPDFTLVRSSSSSGGDGRNPSSGSFGSEEYEFLSESNEILTVIIQRDAAGGLGPVLETLKAQGYEEYPSSVGTVLVKDTPVVRQAVVFQGPAITNVIFEKAFDDPNAVIGEHRQIDEVVAVAVAISNVAGG